jgi:hypothetical protein
MLFFNEVFAFKSVRLKHLTVILAVILTFFPANKLKADGPPVQWEKTFGSGSDEWGYSIQQTSDGGYIIAGLTSSYGAGGYDVYLIKTNSNGDMQWQKTFGGSSVDGAYSVQQTSDGGYVIVGYTNSYGVGSSDVYLIKTNSAGDMLWQKTFGGSSSDGGNSVQQTSDGGYVIVGYTNSYGAGSSDVYLIKTNSAGDMLWQKTFGGRNNDSGFSVQQTSDGGYIIAGETESYEPVYGYRVYLIKADSMGNMQWQKTFGGSGTYCGHSVQQTSDGGYIIAGETNTNVYLIKTNSIGDMQWQKTFGGSEFDYGNSVQQTSDGGYIIAGYTHYPWAPGGSSDVYLVKADSLGNMQWQKTLGGSSWDRGYSVQQTSDGGYIIAGHTCSYGAGGSDVYLIKVAPENTGTVSGVVSDANTGQPIENARVSIATMPHLADTSDSDGHYEIIGVPYNTLFNLVASAADYNTAYINNIQVTEANPVQTVNINLVPSPWTTLRLIELNPNPNSDPMVVMQGGIGHRYYQIVDEGNKPRNGISVTTSPNLGGLFLSSGTIRQGVVSIDVNSLEVNDGQTITVTHLAGVALEPAQQKSFVVNIEPLEQEKVWELKTAADLGISNPEIEAEGSLEIRLRDNQISDGIPEVISISRKAILGGKLSASAKIGLTATVNDFGYNDVGGVSGSVAAGGTVCDTFGFDYDTSNLVDNVAKLDLLLYPTKLLHPILSIIQGGLEATLLPAYKEQFGAGVYVNDSGSAWAGLVLGSTRANLGIGIGDVEAEGNARGTVSFLWYKPSNYALAAEIGGDLKVEGGVLVGGIPLNTLPLRGILPTWQHLSGLYTVRYEVVYDQNVLKKIKVILSMGRQSGAIPYDVTVDQIEWIIKGPPEKLRLLASPEGILVLLFLSLTEVQPQIVNFTSRDIVREIDNIFLAAQKFADLTVTYEVKSLKGLTVDVPVFEFYIGAGVLAEVDINASLEGSIKETRELITERGRLIGIRSYPTESYQADDFNAISITLPEVYAKALTDVDPSILQSIFNYVEHRVQAGQVVVVNAGNSALQIAADVLEAGQKITNIFETQYQPKMQMKMMNTMADSNGSSETRYFGIGGTYQLQPADLNLPSPATFAITYSDEEIIGHNEALLRIYRWSDTDGRWEYIGGTVDDSNNTVTASITKFGTYAIGAQVEYGNFTFHPEPNAVPSDGNSIVTFTSEVIKNNDGTPVANGVLFTLAASGGTITTADVNALLEGVQIATNSGILQFTLKAPQVGMKVKTEAASLNRLAVVTGDVNFVDSNAPQPPTGLQSQIAEGKVLLSWNANSEIDLAGYKIYFDDDTNGPPYNGAAYYSGSNSPVDVAGATEHFLRGLRSGHTYYITVTAYDISGNESSYGNEIVFVNTLPEDSDSDGMSDTWEIAYSNTANGLDPTVDDAMADNDDDGMTNLEEYLTGHNPLLPDVDGDFNHDRNVNFLDLAVFCSHWLEQDCNDPNWCEGADLDHSNKVDFMDFAAFANSWFEGVIVPIPADITGDGKVDLDDLKILIEQWLQSPGIPSADIAPSPLDGIVNFLDFAVIAEHWLKGTSP